ncbi:hypothetical protein BKH41_09295 [Helicobacter sp. 12S02232-10]|nr:hypothetical protein BKH41_09295 [Helicobacter sp. 12S02232-10]
MEEPKDPFKKYKDVQTKDTLIKIDRFLFRVSQNIETISTELNVGIKKIETIKQPIYQKIGGNEESISFNATILIHHIKDYEGFKDLIKQAKPLKLTIFNQSPQKILIQRLSESSKNWVITKERSITYYSKELGISGVLL